MIPAQVREDGYRLGGWVGEQRHAYRDGALDPEHRARLEAVPGWTWNALEARWEKGFARLKLFAGREGRARVPAQYRDSDGFRLGGWAWHQRGLFRRGTLEREHRARLEALPGWTWNPHGDAWEEGFGKLMQFVEREGHAEVPRHHTENGFELGVWVDTQRSKLKKGELPQTRRERLSALPGWTWEALVTAWEQGFAHLESFVAREGHARVPGKWREDGYRLGQWVMVQRSISKKGRLDEDRRTRLEGLSGWIWDPREAAWDEGYAHLVAFAEREDHARVPDSWDEDGYRLGKWVGKQRGLFRRGKLEAKHRARLEALPGWTWNPHEDAWDVGYAHLTAFAEREGHTRVPTQYRDADGYRLGEWVNNQRAQVRRGTLEPERRARLEAIPGWTRSAQQPARAR